MDYSYIERFKKLGFGMFVHFGLYSLIGKGEWYYHSQNQTEMNLEQYVALKDKFNVKKGWAEELVKTAKAAGCKYITLTTRHHEGFSLYDTCGLNDYDAPHSASKRDLVAEFVDACNKEGIMPMFYHTLLDWWHPDYNTNFPSYIDYLVKSVEILCTRYGKIGGLWFDGKWNKPTADWQEDRLYGMIHRLQPEAMVINNTGLGARGQTGHPEIDSVTFERGKPLPIKTTGKPIAGEVCESFTDHWGFCADDICVKSVPHMLELLIDCRKNNCNLLLNSGPKADGSLTDIEKQSLLYIGKWINKYKKFIYDVKGADIDSDDAAVLTDGENYYVAVVDPMNLNENVTNHNVPKQVTLKTDRKILSAEWLDTGDKVEYSGNVLTAAPFKYGSSLYIRVAKLKIAK